MPAPRRRVVELLVLFVLAPSLLALAPGWSIVPASVIGAVVCARLAGSPSRGPDDRSSAPAPPRAWWPGLLVRALLVCAALTALVLWLHPDALFAFPRQRPALWLAVMAGYTVLFALPQEIIYRTFFYARYGQLFARPAARVLASAAAFAWAHVALRNPGAIALAFVGGLAFAWTFERTRSTTAVVLEHALWGGYLLSVGLGAFFRSGGRSLSAMFGL